MDCDEFVELVTGYLEQFRRTIASLGTLPAESLSGAARDRLLNAFRDWPRAS